MLGIELAKPEKKVETRWFEGLFVAKPVQWELFWTNQPNKSQLEIEGLETKSQIIITK